MIDIYLPPAEPPTLTHIKPCFPEHEGLLPRSLPTNCGTTILGEAKEMST